MADLHGHSLWTVTDNSPLLGTAVVAASPSSPASNCSSEHASLPKLRPSCLAAWRISCSAAQIFSFLNAPWLALSSPCTGQAWWRSYSQTCILGLPYTSPFLFGVLLVTCCIPGSWAVVRGVDVYPHVDVKGFSLFLAYLFVDETSLYIEKWLLSSQVTSILCCLID